MPVSYKVSANLYLVQSEVPKSGPPPKQVEVPTNHIAVIDCSGSMYGELPKIREQLKKRLPKLLKEKDTISLVWFSGRGEFGTLLEAEPVATLADLKDVNAAIDRWIKSIGLTGFKEPLEEVSKLIDRVGKKTKGSVFSLFFMSDGCDNQWNRAEILKAVEKAAGGLASATFVEYGYYADRPLLTAMAEKAGGQLIFAEDFDKYAPTFEAVMQRKVSGAPRIELKIQGDTIGGFAFSLAQDELTTYSVDAGAVHVPEDTDSVWYLAPTASGTTVDLVSNSNRAADPSSVGDKSGVDAAYAAVSLFSVRMQPNVVLPLLKALGDVTLIEAFGGCFGKQKYSEFMEAAKNAAFGKGRFENGWDPTKVPADDAFTVLDLLRALASDEENRLLLDHKDFKYSRIGRGRVDASEVLTTEDQAEITKLTEELAKTKDPKKATEMANKIAAIANKGPGLKFAAKDVNDTGYSISHLTFNEERPNCSVLVRKEGTVDISSRVASAPGGAKLPTNFETFIFRNYAIIRDGLVNVDKLPVRLTGGTVRALREQGFPLSAVRNPSEETLEETVTRIKKAANEREVSFVIDLKALPVINRKMVQEVSAKTLFEKEYDLCKARAAQKVYNTYKKEHFPKTSKGFEETYGKDAATWLKEQGFTDYSGFSPKSVQAESTDFYMGKELHVSLKGLSSLPSLKDVKEKMAKGKVNPAGALMVPYVEEVEGFLASDIYKKAADQAKVFEAWLDGQQKASTSKVRGLLFDLAQVKFAIVVGQTWPSEFKSIDENSLKITVDGVEIEGKIEAKETQIKI
jgi:hypothetical protein